MSRRAVAVLTVLCGLLLPACRLDVDVAVMMKPDGTGVVSVEAIADQELVEQVPELADDLRLEDAIANGWRVEGPTADAEGAMSIRLEHDFASAEELASVLNSIGPPLTGMQVARTASVGENGEAGGDVTNAIDGTLVLTDGFRSFADAELIEAVGGQPFGEQLAASGLTPDEAMSFVFRVSLPGELVSSATGTETGDGTIEWTARLDGSSQSLLTQTVQRADAAGNGWARPVATGALVLLIVWVALSIAFVTFVAVARRAKRRRREHALRNLTREL